MTLTCHNDERVRVYVYFFPFDFSERVSFIQSECSYQRMKGNDSVFFNGYGCPDLRFVDNSDRLYIIAHGNTDWICPYISRHLLSLNPLQARCRRYSRGER